MPPSDIANPLEAEPGSGSPAALTASRPPSLFALHWLSTTASYFGDGLRFVAVPLLVTSLSSSPATVATVAVSAGLPWLLFGLISGVVVDRLERNSMLVVLQLISTAIGLTVAGAVLTDTITVPLLVVLVFALGTCQVFYDVALHSFLPAIVDPPGLQRANGRLIVAETTAFEFVGPAAGAWLFALAASAAFFADASTFLLSAVFFWLILRQRRAAGQLVAAPSSHHRSIKADLAEGMRWFRSSRVVRSLSLLAAAINFGLGGFYALFVLFVRQDLGLRPEAYGVLITLGAVGSLLAGLLAERLQGRSARRWTLLTTAPIAALGLGVIAAANSFAMTAASLIVMSFSITLLNVVAISLRQTLTPDELLGRVTSVHRVLCWGALPLGAATSGFVGEVFSVRLGIATGAAAILLMAALTLPQVPESAFEQ